MRVQYDQDSEHQDAHLTSRGGGVGDAVNDGVASTGLTGTPASLHPVGSGISLAAGIDKGVSLAAPSSQLVVKPPTATPAAHQPSPVTAAAGDGRQTGIDEEQRQSTIMAAFQKLSEILEKIRGTEDDEDSWDCMNNFAHLTVDAATLPLPTSIHSKFLGFEFAEGQKQGLIDNLKKTRKWVRSILDKNDDDYEFYINLINNSKNLGERWKIQNRFSQVVANYEGLSPDLPVEAADGKLSRMQAGLEQIDRDRLIEFLPAVKVCTWLESAAARLCSEMKRNYSVKVSENLLHLREELASKILPPGTQQTTQDDKAQTTQEGKPAQTQPDTRGDEDETAGTSIRKADEKADGSLVRPHAQDGTGAIAQNPAEETAFTSQQGARKGNEDTGVQQQDNQMSKDPVGHDHVPTPHQLGHPDGDDGSLRINGTLDLDASAQTQNEQGSQSESSEGQPQPSGKRKHGPAGLGPSIRPADSFYKRPRIESSTGEAVVGEGKGGGRDDPKQLSSRLRQRKYPEDEDVEVMEGHSGDIRDDGQAKENKDEVQPDDNRVEGLAGSSQAVYARIESALTREITYGEIRAAEIDEASKFASTILGEADQSLFSQYIERTRDANTVKDEGSIPCKGTYYHSMATLSLYTLYKTPITITTKRFPEDKYLTVNQVAEIIREVFVCIFPAMFQTLVEALAIVQKPYTSGSGAFSPNQEDSIPQDVLKMKGILKELDNLKSSTLQANMRELRLLIQLRMVYNAAVEPSVDISSVETTFQSTVTEIRQYAANTHEQSMTIKAKSRQEFIKRYFPSQAKQLDAYLRKSHVLHAMVCTFSIGCLWMQPKPHARAWTGISSGLHTIFNIIRECDQEGRVYNICNSLGALTTAYTETESSINVDRALLDGMDEEPLQCIIRLIEEESGASRRVVEEYSPSSEEQGRCSSQPESGNTCFSDSVGGFLDGSHGSDIGSGDIQ